MVKICYILLCHKQPLQVIEQIEYLVQTGACVVYHMDKNSPKSERQVLSDRFSDNPNVETVDPIRAGWGDWSLVKATLRMIKKGLDSFSDATHFYYLSGDCVPIQSHEDLHNHLKQSRQDIIETAEFYHGNWIKTGPHTERLTYYHYFNERKRKWLFYRSYDLQRLLGIERKVPDGLNMAIGSQWWCLQRKTLERIILYLAARPEITRFFKRCWIPDEIFFQTMVATLVSESERVSEPPTFLRFSDYGLPTVFYDDHYDFLTSQNRFFARKISENSKKVKKRLVKRFISKSTGEDNYGNGVETINFTTYTGPEGMRFGETIWKKLDEVDDDKRIFVIISKKWHVGHRVGGAISEIVDVPYIGYIFDEHGHDMDGLGNFEHDQAKRQQNPAAYLRMVMEARQLNQIILGIDSSRHQELEYLNKHCADLRVIEVENEFSEEYLDGHADRAGLMVAKGSSVQKSTLHKSIIQTFKQESRRLGHIGISRYEKLRDWHSSKMRAEILGNLFERDADEFVNMIRQLDIRG